MLNLPPTHTSHVCGHLTLGVTFLTPQHASATASTKSSCSPLRHAPNCSLPFPDILTRISAISRTSVAPSSIPAAICSPPCCINTCKPTIRSRFGTR